jgi:DNA-binding PadR family transcriptional regulator
MGQMRMTWQTLAVLDVMLDRPAERHYGLELTAAAGLKPGTIYPLLARLEGAGWLASDWEEIDERVEGRRRRRYYRLTGLGQRAARTALDAAIEAERRAGRTQRWRPAPRWGG